MKFSYEQMLAPYPIRLSIGTLLKPTLGEIYQKVGFDLYSSYEYMTKLTPEIFYTKLYGDGGLEIWESFSEKQKAELSLFNVAKSNPKLMEDYLELLNFFFLEKVVYIDGYIVWLREGIEYEDPEKLTQEDIVGIISDGDVFSQVLDAIQQICCVYNDVEKNDTNLKFKNSVAEDIYKKIHKKDETYQNKDNLDDNSDYTLGNLISAISNEHPTVSPINVWQLTVFQLVDAFNRRRMNKSYDAFSLNVSVWGDKDNKFDSNSWFKNEYDK